ncbi:MAG TPA: hypothetical protein VFS67_11310 [Polyangiaceae bacterium]|jgi:hypothetical protein|nr:hypothetical protein [Polyangiaceae bacterium]
MLRHSATGFTNHRGLAAFLSSASLWAVPAAAQEPAPSKASCAEAYESAQESRVSGALQQTRSRLAYCAQAECPSFVQKDCARWLEEVDKELPSVVVSVVGLEADASGAASSQAVSLKIDGREVPDPLSGKAINLDPGKHELVLERPGAEPITRTILAQQGVQNRSVEIRLASASLPGDGSSSVDLDSAGSASSPTRTAAYVAWGVGAVGLGAFAVLGTLARTDKDRFEEECANQTSIPANVRPGVCLDTTLDDRKSTYEREEVMADVGLLTGIIGAATGTVLFILSKDDSAPAKSDDSASLHLDVSPTLGGAWAGVRGAF